MSDEQLATSRQITGDDIISEILRNCEAGLFKIRNTTVVPCIYSVYLHPSDYDLIRPVLTALMAEARYALIEKLEQLTAASRGSAIARRLGFGNTTPSEYKIIEPDWTIEFHPDAEDKLQRGAIEIYSELAGSKRPEFSDGAVTRVITRRKPDGQETTSHSASGASPLPRNEYAFLRYNSETGAQTFAITKNQVVIGRGGKSFWVDLKLSAPPDVSREHCRIRRDEVSGRFYIKDVSQYGTLVDGAPVPTSIEDRDGATRDKNVEVVLPSRCTISLAGMFDLQFEAEPAAP